jgi:hypothetical protein
MRVRPSAVAACSISASTTRPAQSCGPPRRCAAADPAAMDAARISGGKSAWGTSTLPAWVIRRFLDPKAEFVLVTDPPQILAGRRLRHARRRA